jgi:competence protein ComEA
MWSIRERYTILGLVGCALVGLLIARGQVRGQYVQVTVAPAASQSDVSWDASIRAARTVSLNTATIREFARLPGVGPALAERLVQYRALHGQFQSVDDIMHIHGIGPGLRARLDAYLVL